MFGPGADTLLRSVSGTTLFAASVLMIMNASMVSPLMPALMDEFAIGESSIGLVMAAYSLPSVVCIPIMGVLADTYSRRYVLSGSLLLVGLGGLGIAVSTTFDQLLALRALQGVGYSGVMPIVVTLFGDLYQGTRETTAQGLRTFFNNVSASLYPVIGGVLLVLTWRAPFYLYLAHIPAALIAFTVLRGEGPSQSEDETTGDRGYVRHLVAAVRHPGVFLVMVIGFLLFFLRYGILTFLPLILIRTFSVDATNTGIYIGLVAACTAVGASQAGRISHWFSQQRTIQIGLTGVGASLIVLPFSRLVPFGTTALLLPIIGYGFTWGLVSPTQKSLLNQAVTSRIRAGTVSAGYTVQNLGKAIGPVFIGVVVAMTDLRIGFVVLGVLSLATTALFAVCYVSR